VWFTEDNASRGSHSRAVASLYSSGANRNRTEALGPRSNGRLHRRTLDCVRVGMRHQAVDVDVSRPSSVSEAHRRVTGSRRGT